MKYELTPDLATMTDGYLRRWRAEAVDVRDRLCKDDPRSNDYDYTIEVIGRELSRREGQVS